MGGANSDPMLDDEQLVVLSTSENELTDAVLMQSQQTREVPAVAAMYRLGRCILMVYLGCVSLIL